MHFRGCAAGAALSEPHRAGNSPSENCSALFVALGLADLDPAFALAVVQAGAGVAALDAALGLALAVVNAEAFDGFGRRRRLRQKSP